MPTFAIDRPLCRQGYAAIAPELYHRASPGFQGDYADTAPAIALARQLKTEDLENDIRATYAFLRQQAGEKIVSTGYCMGGRVSFLANVTVPLRAAASYYGGGCPMPSAAPRNVLRPCCSSGRAG